MKKKIFNIGMAAIIAGALFTGCQGTPTVEEGVYPTIAETDAPAVSDNSYNFDPPQVGEKIAVIKVKDYGEIKIKLFPEQAAKSVENFTGLADMDYYDELIFHRIIENFMIQGGWGELLGKPAAKTIKGEFSANGVENPLKHTRGVISMARTAVNDSASSQFFICQEDCEWLDGKYASFGRIKLPEEL